MRVLPYWLDYVLYSVCKAIKKGLRNLLTRCDHSD